MALMPSNYLDALDLVNEIRAQYGHEPVATLGGNRPSPDSNRPNTCPIARALWAVDREVEVGDEIKLPSHSTFDDDAYDEALANQRADYADELRSQLYSALSEYTNPDGRYVEQALDALVESATEDMEVEIDDPSEYRQAVEFYIDGSVLRLIEDFDVAIKPVDYIPGSTPVYGYSPVRFPR
jgi:hypothetical protein